MNLKIRNITFAAAAALLAAAVAAAQDTMPLPGIPAPSATAPADTAAAADSLRITPAMEMSRQASEAYGDYRKRHYDGEIPDNLYPLALTACDFAAKALRSEGATDEVMQRNTAIIKELYPMLAKAAVYYSQKGDSPAMLRAAAAYVDIVNMPELAGYPFLNDPNLYPMLIYTAASGAYNGGDYPKALDYFEVYMKSGDRRYRENIAMFMGQSALALGVPERAMGYVERAAAEFPSNSELLVLAIRLGEASGNAADLAGMLERALVANPGDEVLLKMKGELHEKNLEFRQALDVWNTLVAAHPQSLTYNEHLAQTYYNLGVGYYNESIMADNEKEAKKLRRLSKQYFESSIPKLEEILANIPNSTRYLKALGVVYGCLDLKDEFERINNRLVALGQDKVARNQMPGMIVPEGAKAAGNAAGEASAAVPPFEAYAREYIEDKFSGWAAKSEFETVEEYSGRIGDSGMVDAEYSRLLAEAGEEYLKKYARRLRITDMRLSDYDAANQTFMVATSYGPVVIFVPKKGKEAEMFKANWDAVQIQSPKFYIKDNQVALASITFRTPAGKKYGYDAAEAKDYQVPFVSVDINSILAAKAESSARNRQTASSGNSGAEVYIGMQSDVDKAIPETNRRNDNTYVLIIANENYEKTKNVASARNDGEMFRKYCLSALGVPETQILFYPDATLNGVREGIALLGDRVKVSGKTPDIIFYYAGHGLPDDATKTAYMLPVDANPNILQTWIPMAEVYKNLTSIRSNGVMAFVDACFSGASRSEDKEEMLNERRGVVLKPKEMVPPGADNLFVLTAASSSETALPYKEKNHGLFTYFLLKKLQESKGNASLSEITEYVKENVRKTAISKFQKDQNPAMMVNGRMANEWQNKKLK